MAPTIRPGSTSQYPNPRGRADHSRRSDARTSAPLKPRLKVDVPPAALAAWVLHRASLSSHLVLSLRASARQSGSDFASLSTDSLQSAFIVAMSKHVATHCAEGLLPSATIAKVTVTMRMTKAGDALYVFTMPCAPDVKTAILASLVQHHAGQLPLDLERKAPARAFACPDGARDAADTLSLIRIEMSRDDSGITPGVLMQTLSLKAPGLLWVAKVVHTGDGAIIEDSACSPIASPPSRFALKGYTGSTELIALFSGCHEFLSDAQAAGINLCTPGNAVLNGMAVNVFRIIPHLPQSATSPPPHGTHRRWEAPPAVVVPPGRFPTAAPQKGPGAPPMSPPPTAAPPAAATSDRRAQPPVARPPPPVDASKAAYNALRAVSKATKTRDAEAAHFTENMRYTMELAATEAAAAAAAVAEAEAAVLAEAAAPSEALAAEARAAATQLLHDQSFGLVVFPSPPLSDTRMDIDAASNKRRRDMGAGDADGAALHGPPPARIPSAAGFASEGDSGDFIDAASSEHSEDSPPASSEAAAPAEEATSPPPPGDGTAMADDRFAPPTMDAPQADGAVLPPLDVMEEGAPLLPPTSPSTSSSSAPMAQGAKEHLANRQMALAVQDDACSASVSPPPTNA